MPIDKACSNTNTNGAIASIQGWHLHDCNNENKKANKKLFIVLSTSSSKCFPKKFLHICLKLPVCNRCNKSTWQGFKRPAKQSDDIWQTDIRAVLLLVYARHCPLQKHLFNQEVYSLVLLPSPQMIQNEWNFLFLSSLFAFFFFSLTTAEVNYIRFFFIHIQLLYLSGLSSA